MLDQQSAQQRLTERGILQATTSAGWKFNGDGWVIPLHQPSGERLPRTAWKAYDSQAVPKYRIPYKKDEYPIYAMPGIAGEVRLRKGILYIAGGFVDLMTLQEVGIKNSISFTRENSIPDNLIATLRGWGVKTVLNFPHRDSAGRNASQKIKDILSDSDITFKAYELPPGLGESADLNDLWQFIGFNRKLFLLLLRNANLVSFNPQPVVLHTTLEPKIILSDTTQQKVRVAPSYGELALEDEVTKIKAASAGGRNEQLNRSAFKLGQLIGAEVLDRATVERELEAAALSVGLTSREIKTTLTSGLTAGIAKPREIKERPRRTQQRGTDRDALTRLQQATETVATTRLPKAARDKLWREKFETSRGNIPGATVARMLDALSLHLQPGETFTAGRVIQICEEYGVGKSHVYAILKLTQEPFSPETALFFLVGWETSKFGEKACRPARIYRMPSMAEVCKWLEVTPDLMPEEEIPAEALASNREYRQAAHELYLCERGETTEPASYLAQRLGVKSSTIWAYEKEMADRLQREARYQKTRLYDADALPDEATARAEGLFLENGAGVRGRVNRDNYFHALEQTGQVYLVRRLSSRRIYQKVEAEVPEEPAQNNSESAVVYCQYCGQQHHLAFGQPPRECQTCREVYGKEGKAYWGEEPPPVSPEELRRTGKPRHQ